MNNKLKRVSLESLLVFDIETAARNKELDLDSKEFELYAWSLRDKDTGVIPDNETVQLHYKLNAALKPEFNRIVCISIGILKGDTLFYKAIVGDQKEIIEEFYNIVNTTGLTLAGHNIINFDLPVIRLKAFECGITTELPDKYVDSGKKPWNMSDAVIDTMELSKGTYYFNISLDSMCMLAGIDSPKTDLCGAKVSETFYSEGVDRIATYCNQDIIACMKLIAHMKGDLGLIKNFVNRDEKIVQAPILTVIANTQSISKLQEDKLLEIACTLTKKEREGFVTLIKAALGRNEQDKDKSKLCTEEDFRLFNKILSVKKGKSK